MGKLTLLIPPGSTVELFGQRLHPHNDDVDNVQPYDAREAKVLNEAIAWGLLDLYDAPSWYTLTEVLPFPAVPAGVQPILWIPFRTWAGWIKGHPVSALATLPEFNPALYAPSGEPYPEGTVFTSDGQATVPAGVKPLGDLHIPASIAEAKLSAEDEGLTIRQVVTRIRGGGG